MPQTRNVWDRVAAHAVRVTAGNRAVLGEVACCVAHGGLCRPLGLVRSRGACWGGQRRPVGPAVDSAVVLAAKHSAGWIAQDSGLTAAVHGLHCLPPTKIIILACFSYSQLRCSSFSI